MNLHLLRVFINVVEAQSFSRAAETLGTSQPATSKAVRELESQLDTVLLERKGRHFQPSEAGRVLYDYGRSIFALERRADEAVRSFGTLERGELTIGASTTIATYWLPPLLCEFHQRHPGVAVRLVSANTRQIAERLLDCQVDVALVEGPVDDERLESRPWRDEQMVVVAPKNAGRIRRGGDYFEEQVWVVREPGSGSREVSEHILRRLGVKHPRTIEVGSNEAIVQTVAAGVGLGVVPRICARDQLALGRVRQVALEHGPIQRPLYRLRLPQRPVSHVALAFEALIA